MTVEQAIRLLDPATAIEALAEIEYYRGFDGQIAAGQAFRDACIFACDMMREHERVCRKLLEEEVLHGFTTRERDALRADLEAVCGQDAINTCPVCGHWRTDWAKPGCELNGLTCAWFWRGVQEG